MTKSRHNFHLGLALFLMLCAGSLDYVLLSVRADSAAAAGSNDVPVSLKSNSLYSVEDLSQGVRDAVEMIRPSLVTISTVSKLREINDLLPEFSDGDYRPLNDNPNRSSFIRSNADRSNVATGVILSEDGFIGTSSDAVHNLDSVIVNLQNDASYEGKVVLHEPESNLAIIKVEADKLPAAHLGSTVKPRLADWAIAVALNDQNEPIISAGLISSFGENRGSQSRMKRIHFAFPVSADFRGCAFVNLSGELIGIHAPNWSRIANASTSCVALDTETVNELQRKTLESNASNNQEPGHQKSTWHDSTAVQHFTQKGKEEALSKIDKIRELFSVPRSEWTSATIASSVQSWLFSWLDANNPPTHPVSNASESR